MIVNRQRCVPVALKSLQKFYDRARSELGFASESITVQLISDAAMSDLNWKFRKKRGPTDVLSFPANDERTDPQSEYVGDIAISAQTARRNAKRFRRTFPVEMQILVLHGLIHLAGFDHETDEGQMERLESRLRKRLGVTGIR